MLSRTGELDMPGVPPNPLPIWRHLPLNYKLPMPTVVPRGAVQLYTGHIGEEVGCDEVMIITNCMIVYFAESDDRTGLE